MAIDEAILTSVAAEQVLPTLRIYSWKPMCLSLGYGQRIREVDMERLAARGWHLVRRITGGKAILHGDELTYSVSLPLHDPLAQGDILSSYRYISQALVRALELLGLSAQSERQVSRPQSVRGPVCFEVPSHYEITSNKRKLIGSAQVRRKGGILQHGTLPLYGDVSRICDVLAYETDQEREQNKAQVRSRALTLEEVLASRPSWQRVADAIASGFAETFDLELQASTLSVEERQFADTLLLEKYGTTEWNNKR